MANGKRLAERIRSVRARTGDTPQAFPPGAFYSPVVNAAEVLSEPELSRIWPQEVSDPPGIDFRGAEQLALLESLSAYPFAAVDRPGPRYDPNNDQFPPHDAALLYAMVRFLRPARMIEIGCGWSTTVTAAAVHDGSLDTSLVCIEPYPREFLHEMGALVTLRVEKVEHSPLQLFEDLEAGDILFIDSSHVAKTGSDVVHELLEIVPRLADGVIVHVHDIFIPEDYPKGWVRNGFGWTEQYVLQAYLSGSARAHIIAMNRWLALRHPEAIEAAFGPLELNGSSAWFVTGPQGAPVGSRG